MHTGGTVKEHVKSAVSKPHICHLQQIKAYQWVKNTQVSVWNVQVSNKLVLFYLCSTSVLEWQLIVRGSSTS